MNKFYLMFLLVFFPFHANAIEPLKVTYGLYASGFNVVEIEGTYTLNQKTYNLEMDLKTTGLLGRLAPWGGVIQSNGVNRDVNIIPQGHSFASTWKGETETTQFSFDKNGRLISHSRTEDNGEIIDKMPPVDVYKDNPTDMLSALFKAMNSNSCAGAYPALDGKRRFDMVFESKGMETLNKSKYSAFQGEAEICTVEIKPVAGKWREKPRGWMSIQEQAKGKGQLPKLWFGKIRNDMPAIPVRFFIKTNYGAMVMHLKDVID